MATHPLSYEAICGERARREDAWNHHKRSPATTPDPLWRWHPNNKDMGFLRGSLMSKQPVCCLCRKELAPMEAGWGEVAPRDVGWCDGTCEADEARRMEDLDRAKFEIVCLKQQLAHVHRELERMSNALHVAIGAKPPM